MPKTKTTKKTSTSRESSFLNGDSWSILKQIMEKTVVTVFWENVDKAERKVKVTFRLALKMLISGLIIFTGLIFLICGVSEALDAILNIVPGIGYTLSGLFAIVLGLIISEKAKEEKRREEEK